MVVLAWVVIGVVFGTFVAFRGTVVPGGSVVVVGRRGTVVVVAPGRNNCRLCVFVKSMFFKGFVVVQAGPCR